MPRICLKWQARDRLPEADVIQSDHFRKLVYHEDHEVILI